METLGARIENNLQALWLERYLGRVAPVRAGLRALKDSKATWGARELSDIVLLEASLARHDGRTQEAWALIERARAIQTGAGEEPSFHFLLQSAISLMTDSRFAEAMRYLNEAAQTDTDPTFLLVVKFNLAICLFNLSLPNSRIVAEIESALKNHDSHPLRPALYQLRVLEMERAILAGDFPAVFSQSFPDLHQGSYVQSLWASTPWLAKYEHDIKARFTQACSDSTEFFQKMYRLQTVSADSRIKPNPDSVPTIQLQADRLFLWTWKWLAAPGSAIGAMLAEEWRRFPWDQAHLSLVAIDFLMLRSAGSWLGAFDPVFARDFRAWCEKSLPPGLPPSAFFELDLRLSQAFTSHDEESWSSLIAEFTSSMPSLQPYFEFVRSLRNPPLPCAPGNLTVDLAGRTLEFGGERWTSEPMALLLSGLKETGMMEFPDVLSVCFQIPDFDDFVHAPKIHNLLHRIKACLPEGACLWTKAGRVYLNDAETRIQIHKGSPHRSSFPDLGNMGQELGKKQSKRLERDLQIDAKLKLFEIFSGNGELTRLEIQQALNLPKATTNRWISAWIDKNLLEKQGDGRHSRYRIRTIDSPNSTHKKTQGRKTQAR